MAKQNMGGVYANMDFKTYEWQEYPKHVKTGSRGEYVTVANAAEEQAVLSRLQKDEDNAPAYVAPYVADPAKEILISRARELGVAFNSKWSKAKLEQVVSQAEFDVDNLPAEVTPTKKVAAVVEEETDEDEPHQSQDELKDALIAHAKSLGVNANRLWGIPRLKATIAEIESK